MRVLIRRLWRPLVLLGTSFASSALPAAEPPGTVLVLPLIQQGELRSVDWIGESVSESIREALESYGVLTTDRRDREEATERLGLTNLPKFTRASILKLGESLDAGVVVAGRFAFTPTGPPLPGAPPGVNRDSKGTLHLFVQLVFPQQLRASEELEELGPVEQLAALQNRLAWRVLEQIAPGRAGEKEDFLASRPAIRLDALEQYIRGLAASKPEDQQRYWTQAARLDPRYFQPAFQLGMLHFDRGEHQAAGDWFRKVPRNSSRFFEATFFLGITRYRLSDFVGAEKAFQTVAAEVPLNEVYNNLGLAQLRRGTIWVAIESLKKALAGDPSDPDYHFNLGYALWKRGDFAAAGEQFRAILERDAADATAGMMLSRCARREGPQRVKKEEGLERLKTDYQERVYRQLKAVLEPDRKQ